MAYGTVKVDNITFDNGGSDQNVTVSGLYRATTSGVTLSGTIAATTVSGVTIIGSTTVSGATVTGTTANFTSGNFSNIISSAATMSGALIMANQQQVRFREAVGNGVNHIALQAPAIVSADQTITLPDQTGTVITTGDNGSVSSTMLATNLTISAAAGSATTPSIAFTGDLNTGIYSPGADQLALSTAGNGRLFIDGTGFVGIGTVPAVGYGLDVRGLARLLTVGGASGLEIGTGTATNQFASLDLVGDATYTDYGLRLLRGDSGANAESNIAHKGTGALSLITEEAAPIVLATSNAERLRIDSAGNVGIGTSSPSSPLTVNGKTTLVGPEDGQLEWSLGGQAWRANIVSGGKWYLYDATNAKFPLDVVTNSTCKIDINTSHLAFNTGSSERARIDSSGNVGIGTSAPSDMLSVVKIDTSNSLFDSDAAITVTNPNSDTFGRSTNLNFNQGTDASIGRLASIAGVYTNFSTSVGGALAFSTNNGSGTVGERLRIDSSGNVGIGTLSPAVPLDVVGQVRTTDSTVDLRLLPLAGSDVGIVGTISNHDLSLFTNDTERARIDSSGRLLVGTSSASNFIGTGFSSLFQVQESEGILGFGIERPTNDTSGPSINFRKTRATSAGGVTVVQNGDYLAELRFLGTDGTGSIVAAGIAAAVDGTPGTNDMPGRLTFSTTADGAASPTERMRITSAGNVGIGTSSPSFNLVSANNTTDGGWLYSSGSVSTLGLGGYSLAGDGAFQLKYERSTGVITFNGGSRDTPVERLRIDSSGRLLVGTSSARSNFFNSTIPATILLENNNAVLGVVRNGNNAFSPYLVLAKSRSASNTIVQADDQLGAVNFQGNDGTEFVEAAQIAAFVDGTPGANDMPGRLVFSTAADGAAFTTERLRITSAGVLQVADAGNITVGTTTGTKIGTATTQKIGFYNATPVVQPTAVADATDAATVITQLNALLTRMRNLGLIAT